jgi:hypothetical protein
MKGTVETGHLSLKRLTAEAWREGSFTGDPERYVE